MKKRILVVDDEPLIRKNYVKVLQGGSSELFDVLEAANAVQATNIIIRENIDLILLDLRMPGISGQRLFDVIHDYDPQMKVMVASVYPEDRQKDLVPQAQDYYDKAQGPLKLLEKILSILYL